MRSWGRRIVLLALLVVAACTSEPIQNVDHASFNHPVTLDQAQSAIMRAGTSLGWDMSVVRPGEIEGRLDVRQHRAVVDITYDSESFSIGYVDSEGLDYDDDGTIHRNYNRWVRNLRREIRAQSFQ